MKLNLESVLLEKLNLQSIYYLFIYLKLYTHVLIYMGGHNVVGIFCLYITKVQKMKDVATLVRETSLFWISSQ